MSLNPLSTLSGEKGASSAKEIKTDILKIRGKTLIFHNTIYQISNIAAIEIVTFSKAFPIISTLALVVGLFIIRTGGLFSLIGLLLIGWGAYALYRYWEKRLQYGLLLLLNAGADASSVLISTDEAFLKKVALTIYNIMNNEEAERAINFHFDQRTITDVTTISQVTGSIINTGAVGGDIANSVQ